MVEMAIVLPLLLLLVFGIIEFGLAWFDKQSISQGVREAARQGVVRNWDGGDAGCTGSPLQKLACQAGRKIDIGGVGVRVEAPTLNEGDPITVCAKHTYRAITGILNPFLDGRVLKSSVTMRMEQDETGGGSATWTNAGGTAPTDAECP